ncbi:hypothetical protein HPB48_014934 [Haemaphysalis longicornis]|uniref:Endonuclease/exonuclease/phosphatase domain-containing protein n=1 Tax=Haemaphysalis longicornis TaxID=44386 RepID=A0A9J6FGA1_HAELO|nr:hypothetical protein HPB48_014934 [Haemaphysalis longicornis]
MGCSFTPTKYTPSSTPPSTAPACRRSSQHAYSWPPAQENLRAYLLVSAYYRPETSKSTKGSLEWVGELRMLYPTDHIIIGWDFNAKHTNWNYTTNTPRGNDLQATMETYGFYLQNNSATPTRIGLCETK